MNNGCNFIPPLDTENSDNSLFIKKYGNSLFTFIGPSFEYFNPVISRNELLFRNQEGFIISVEFHQHVSPLSKIMKGETICKVAKSISYYHESYQIKELE